MTTRRGKAGKGRGTGKPRKRLQLVGLGLSLAAVAVFAVSFLVGLGDALTGGPAPAPDSTAVSAEGTPAAPAPAPSREEIPQGGGAQANPEAPARTIRVEVLNGAGRGGIAEEATRLLRDRGFDVVFFGNASRFDHSTSSVLGRSGNQPAARAVAAALGIEEVRNEPDASLFLDATVILGGDWRQPTVPAEAGWVDRARRWLRPGGEG